MTLLEILAARIATVAQEADRLATYYIEKGDKELIAYYVGRANGLRVAADMLRLEALGHKRGRPNKLRVAADMLRLEALEREGIDKEERE